MNTTEQAAFAKANETIHPVETQWHYPIMVKHNFVPKDKTGVGFVRSYDYEHPTAGVTIRVTTGSSADYWSDLKTKAGGYWSTLEAYVEKVLLP